MSGYKRLSLASYRFNRSNLVHALAANLKAANIYPSTGSLAILATVYRDEPRNEPMISLPRSTERHRLAQSNLRLHLAGQ